jgi:hypothetical protein
MSHDGNLLFRIPITLVATLLTVVACGPRKDYVPFERVPQTAVGKTLAQCQARLSAGKGIRISEQSRPVTVCESETTGQRSPDDPFGNQKPQKTEAVYKLVDQNARYNVEKNSTGNVAIRISIGVVFPDSLQDEKANKETRQAIAHIIAEQCFPKIKGVMDRSSKERPIDLAISFFPRKANVSYDQNITIVAASDPTSSRLAYSLANRPKSPPMYLTISPEVEAACKETADPEACGHTVESFERSNDPFCRDFGQVVGQWLGLQPDPLMQTTCQVANDPAKPKPAPTGAPTAVPNTAAKPTEPAFMHQLASAKMGDDFWNTAKFSQDELGQILSPACPAPEMKKKDDKNATLAGD